MHTCRTKLILQFLFQRFPLQYGKKNDGSQTDAAWQKQRHALSSMVVCRSCTVGSDMDNDNAEGNYEHSTSAEQPAQGTVLLLLDSSSSIRISRLFGLLLLSFGRQVCDAARYFAIRATSPACLGGRRFTNNLHYCSTGLGGALSIDAIARR